MNEPTGRLVRDGLHSSQVTLFLCGFVFRAAHVFIIVVDDRTSPTFLAHWKVVANVIPYSLGYSTFEKTVC